MYGHFSDQKTVFIDLFPVKKCVFAYASLETGNSCIEITSHHFSIVLFYSFLDLKRCIALLSISFHLKKNPINHFEVPDPIVSGNTNQPRIKCDIDKEEDLHEIANESVLFEVKAEQFTAGTTKDFAKSMALLISPFYVFNVEYPSRIENTLTFIQKFSLDINGKSKTSDKVLKFMSVLKKKLNGF